MEPESLQGTRTLIIGLGATGLSCARFLARRGIEVAVIDSREQPPALADIQRELPDVALFTGGFDAEVFGRAERILVSPGVSLQEPLLVEAQQRGIEVIGDIELFARTARAPVVAITGSNGKSTVTTLLGAMARQAGMKVRVGGNLGTPALDLIGEQEPDLYVLELSSFQLETVQSLHCQAATVLNISPDHLDRYESVAAYARAKQRIFAGTKVQIVNRDDVAAAGLASEDVPVVGFGLGIPAAQEFGLLETADGCWIAKGKERWMPVSAVRMPGRHNLANALAALALGDALGFPRKAMLQVLEEFQGLPHRTQWVAEVGGVRWFNDSKATNVGAALAAVRGFDEPLVLLIGGQGKGADFSGLAAGLDAHVKAVVLLGEATEEIEAALQGKVVTQRAFDMFDAVRQAAALAAPGDTVLLSPACASFDMFKDYQQRGETFMQAVRELKR
ncbi:MAG: UDP-N-acetylmuramoyl-L-alanine--D-glutamate ligase [Gammaproteobacteria bacterium]|nr:MAG: UDP-N-acetylmuramoyl-L-alanine--D-glutamate ligase [Gammaproteobacteria bacterium]